MEAIFQFSKTTKNFHKYEREVKTGEFSGVLYVPLNTFPADPPTRLTVTAEYDSNAVQEARKDVVAQEF
jgi:hypothetical protein